MYLTAYFQYIRRSQSNILNSLLPRSQSNILDSSLPVYRSQSNVLNSPLSVYRSQSNILDSSLPVYRSQGIILNSPLSVYTSQSNILDSSLPVCRSQNNILIVKFIGEKGRQVFYLIQLLDSDWSQSCSAGFGDCSYKLLGSVQPCIVAVGSEILTV